MTGMIGFSNFESNSKIWFKGNTRGAGWKYDYSGNEALIISSGTYADSSICFWSSNAGTLSDSGGQWNSVVPSMAIKGPHVTIGAAAQTDRALYVKTTDGTAIGLVSSATYSCINYSQSSSYSWSVGSNSSG